MATPNFVSLGSGGFDALSSGIGALGQRRMYDAAQAGMGRYMGGELMPYGNGAEILSAIAPILQMQMQRDIFQQELGLRREDRDADRAILREQWELSRKESELDRAARKGELADALGLKTKELDALIGQINQSSALAQRAADLADTQFKWMSDPARSQERIAEVTASLAPQLEALKQQGENRQLDYAAMMQGLASSKSERAYNRAAANLGMAEGVGTKEAMQKREAAGLTVSRIAADLPDIEKNIQLVESGTDEARSSSNLLSGMRNLEARVKSIAEGGNDFEKLALVSGMIGPTAGLRSKLSELPRAVTQWFDPEQFSKLEETSAIAARIQGYIDSIDMALVSSRVGAPDAMTLGARNRLFGVLGNESTPEDELLRFLASKIGTGDPNQPPGYFTGSP